MSQFTLNRGFGLGGGSAGGYRDVACQLMHRFLSAFWRHRTSIVLAALLLFVCGLSIQLISVSQKEYAKSNTERWKYDETAKQIKEPIVKKANRDDDNSNMFQPIPAAYNGAKEGLIVYHNEKNKERRSLVGGESKIKSQEDLLVGNGNGAKDATGLKGFVPKLRVVHFDLKGAPPTVDYLEKIFPLIHEAGANTILLEYEDMFPFWGRYAPVAAHNAYSRSDVQRILGFAKKYRFEVIPLIQTFGHMEYILKLKEFQHLRELDQYPGALCPSKNESLDLVYEMIDQMMSLHRDSRWLHIGCDEVFQLGQCSKCMYVNRNNLLLSHVRNVAQYVRQKHKVIPIVWDDMFRNMDSSILKEYDLGDLVEPMIWVYIQDIMRFIPQGTWYMFGEVFPNIWVASAFKGAFGETLTTPDLKKHLENNEAWLQVMEEQQKGGTVKNFRGLVMTGWQRYDHFGTLCELLPAGLPSLVLNMLTLKKGYFEDSLFHPMKLILQCTATYNQWRRTDLDQDPYLYSKLQFCFFPGAQVYQLTKRVAQQVKEVDEYAHTYTVHKSWLTDYNVRRNYTNPQRVDEAMEEFHMIYYDLTSTISTAREALRNAFDEYTVAEWVEQNLYPYLKKMDKIKDTGDKLKAKRVWQKRPLPILADLRKYNFGDDGMRYFDPNAKSPQRQRRRGATNE